ncbi:DUF5693 family protein [Paenibacillus abyssi]|uniref:Uncharacterized protein n=1 Tax=Paenibacillus abyssi TaxID=1340531 RepID=A0A917FNI1_9BACL|nr:DUF5693 family protein [Paenibacillus abyssi]GGF91661.1 hypothetical protein GCM10010916_06230 [Paenibacillus abyssi]
MFESIQQWNRKARKWLWLLVIIGILASLPLGAVRYQMEKTSDEVEFIFDYRDLVLIASYQANPQDFIAEQLPLMKEAGIGTMAVFEGSLEELFWSGRISYYNSAQAAALQGKPAPFNENYTYILFNDPSSKEQLEALIRQPFDLEQINVRPWSFDGRDGLTIETPVENAVVKPMLPDPTALAMLKEQGFHLLPRLSDRMRPYDAELTEDMIEMFAGLGVKRILFDGGSVKGYADQAELKSLSSFGHLLKEHGIGIAAIENLRSPQNGINTLAYITDYNVTRLYSLSEAESMTIKPSVMADRFLLAAKDRNIRMFYLNGQPLRSLEKASIIHSLDNVYEGLKGDEDTEGAVALLESQGFKNGVAEPFDYQYESWMKIAKGVVAAGAVALIALLIGGFIPVLLIPAFVVGLIGSAGLYVLSPAVLEQALALGAAISAPTLAMLWVIGRIRLHTEGERRSVGGQWRASAERNDVDKLFGGQWVFPGLSAGRRVTMAIGLYASTAVISLIGVPLIIGLLNNITYSLVLQQFRGVSLLHLAPIGLVALYLFLYTGTSVLDNLRKLLKLQITVLWVAAAGVIGVVGLYYLSRTGNAGQVSSMELVFRSLLETTFGVRPRTKEFLLAHPIFILGLFLALRYRAAWVLLIVATIGQLSMVGTFTHIHTPLYISIIRVLLGLGLGAIIGLALIAAWQIAEGVWRRWAPKKAKASE